MHVSNNGSADQYINEALKNIEKEITSTFQIAMNSYDADPSYDSAQVEYFATWTRNIRKSSTLLKLGDCIMTPNDPAHIPKRIRKHLVKYGIVFLKDFYSNESINSENFFGQVKRNLND